MSKLKKNEVGRGCVSLHGGERGFGLLQILIAMAIITVVSTFAFLGIARARDDMRLQNSMRVLAGNVEKARIYAIRSHKSASIEFTSNNTYTLSMDFNGTGDETTKRAYLLDPNIIITNADGTAVTTTDLPIIEFNWRGSTTQCSTLIRMQNSTGKSSTLQVTTAGDITVDSNLGATVSPGAYTNVNRTADIASGATIAGGDVSPVINPCGTSTYTPPTAPPPPPGCSQFNLSDTTITIRRNGFNSGTITVTATTLADTIKVIQTDGRSNLDFQPSTSQSIAAGSSKTFTIKSKNNLTGQFPIKFISSCNSSYVQSALVVVTK